MIIVSHHTRFGDPKSNNYRDINYLQYFWYSDRQKTDRYKAVTVYISTGGLKDGCLAMQNKTSRHAPIKRGAVLTTVLLQFRSINP